ncbi:MAG: ROK family transcriptional regulator, partial [Actinoplanes sp.]
HVGADFAYLFLGEGLGCAVVGDGAVRRGRNGLAGEIAHLVTVGPAGEARYLIEVFGELGLRQQNSSAIDVRRLLAADDATRAAIGRAVGGVIAAVITLTDPELVVLGGSWGPALLADIRAAVERMPRRVPVRAAAITTEPALAGVRREALDLLRAKIAGG